MMIRYCLPCAGSYNLLAGQTSCVNCTANTYSLAGSTVCLNCSAGSWQPNNGATFCSACVAGRYGIGCLACPRYGLSLAAALMHASPKLSLFWLLCLQRSLEQQHRANWLSDL